MKKSSSILVNSNIDKNSIDSIAIGGFDGMHIAHQELFKNLNPNGAIISIETGYANLTPKKNRQEYTKYPIFYYDLEDIKALDGVEFIKMLQDDFKNLKKIVVGFDFGFGKNRAYKADDLNSLFDGEVIVVPEIKLNNSSIHSRVIREFIKEAKIKEANDFLGKEYKICGTVIKGQGLGKDEFVPTINIEVNDFLLPKSGVYVTKTIVDKIEYNSITFLGHRVTT
ncbi:MAG: bifunctional riboflavin kinase/FAD synthetase, partial [Arcobacter skirrowii]|nr:bifunctional riboflavin kinase/FAD synthetase [Aliarcobacter skirrowii]